LTYDYDSQSRPGVVYTTAVGIVPGNPLDAVAKCNCPGYKVWDHCWHQQDALHMARNTVGNMNKK